MKLIVTMDWVGCSGRVGELEIFNNRGTETYQFTYTQEWVKKGFQIDPALALLAEFPQHSQTLPGVFQDICPDRWGRLVQKRAKPGHFSDADLMLGVSDFMRMGALRLSEANRPEVFLANNTQVPKLVHLRELAEASRRLEQGLETETDLTQLLEAGSSLGGAHPKAVVQDGHTLYLAKFQSHLDTERVCAWEATMLDLAQKAGIATPKHRLLNPKHSRPILLLERFDRSVSGRIPFASAMTLSGRQDRDDASYAELASVVSSLSAQAKLDSFDLWRRMTFNAMAGNTDDHLRNHAFLRTPSGWRLAPAYDLNPNAEPLERRSHALAFLPGEHQPSLKLCLDMADFFNLDKRQVQQGLASLAAALTQWRSLAKNNGLMDSELKRYAEAFEHEDMHQLLASTQSNIKNRLHKL